MDLNHRPHPYQLNSGTPLMKVREVNEGACLWMRPAGRDPVVVSSCCQPNTADPPIVAEHRRGTAL
jgi:hypothetical protein